MIYPVDSAVQRLNKRGQLYKVLLNLHIFPVLKKAKNCTEQYLLRYKAAIYIFILIKIIVQFFECKIPERVINTGAISQEVFKRFAPVCS